MTDCLHDRAGTPQRQHDLLANLVPERPDRLERRAIGGDDLIANEQAGLLGRRALDHAADEAAALRVGTREDADAGIGDAAARKGVRQSAPPQRAGEDIGELVVFRFVRRVIACVRRMQLGQHAVDDAGQHVLGGRSRGVRHVAFPDRCPV